MDKLKPCPFCGGKAELVIAKWNPEIVNYVRCTKCCTLQGQKETKQEAIDAWNMRINDEERR